MLLKSKRRAFGLTATVALLGLCSPILHAQSNLDRRAGITGAVDSSKTKTTRGPSLLAATFSSALVPGAGQAMLRSKRAVFYAGAEIVGLVAYYSQHGTGERQRDLYHDLARTIGRAQFSPDGPVGDWDYYERMEKYASSGAYDAIPGGALDPETDPTTYNGSIWLLARQTYWRDPNVPPSPQSLEFHNAMAFYTRRAIPEEMRWSWVGSDAGLQRYQRAIASSNNAFKRAEQTLGLVIANHFLSAIDAFVSVRLRASQTSNGRVILTTGIPIGTAH